MRLPVVSRRRHDAELAAVQADLDASRENAVKWHASAVWVAEQAIDIGIVNNRLTDGLTVSRRQRVIARKAGRRILAAYAAEQQRADHLQQRLDQALGLDTAAVALGASWQDRRQVRMYLDKPTAEEAS